MDQILTWDYAIIKTPYLDMVEGNIRRTLNNLTQILQMLVAQRNCSDITRQIAQTLATFNQSDPSLLETLYNSFDAATKHYNQSNELNEKEKNNLLNCIQSLQYQIGKVSQFIS